MTHYRGELALRLWPRKQPKKLLPGDSCEAHLSEGNIHLAEGPVRSEEGLGASVEVA